MSLSNTQFDVCIRGAGIVGRSLALMLASQGLRVALVNLHASANAGQGHSDVRAYALNMAAKQLLTDLRCWPEDSACTPILKMHIEGDQDLLDTIAAGSDEVAAEALFHKVSSEVGKVRVNEPSLISAL